MAEDIIKTIDRTINLIEVEQLYFWLIDLRDKLLIDYGIDPVDEGCTKNLSKNSQFRKGFCFRAELIPIFTQRFDACYAFPSVLNTAQAMDNISSKKNAGYGVRFFKPSQDPVSIEEKTQICSIF